MSDISQAKKEALASVLSILSDQSEAIWGYSVCQDCGEIDHFQGVWGARASHGTTEFGPRFSRAKEHGHEKHQERAFCEVCQEPIKLGELLLCRSCEDAFSKYAPKEEWDEMLSHFIRQRPRFQGILTEDDFFGKVAHLKEVSTYDGSGGFEIRGPGTEGSSGVWRIWSLLDTLA